MNAVFTKKSLFTCSFLLILNISSFGQLANDTLAFFEIPKSLNKTRFNVGITTAVVTFSGFSYGLYNTWYKQFETEPFHLFNDLGEWEDMDKYGHLYTAYFQSNMLYNTARWTGLNKRKSILTGVISATIFQSTVEIMDGFSSGWGFSLSDMAANSIGIAAFALQQKHWDEQRILFKVSSWPKSYSATTFKSTDGLLSSSLDERANDLFGTKFAERYLKDYNAQTIWASVNVHSFLPEGNQWPRWLNLAAGYSAENMFGGFENEWQVDNSQFVLSPDHDRYVQFVISPDIDLTKIHTDNRFLKLLLGGFNIFKLPMPGISLNTRGDFKLHFIYKN